MAWDNMLADRRKFTYTIISFFLCCSNHHHYHHRKTKQQTFLAFRVAKKHCLKKKMANLGAFEFLFKVSRTDIGHIWLVLEKHYNNNNNTEPYI